MKALTLGVALLALGLAACSDDDDNGKTDAAPAIEASILEGGADQSVSEDGPAPDQQVAGEDATAVDSNNLQPAILTAAHVGWQVVNCAAAGCHTLPVNQEAYHVNATIGGCADCHGGNGACVPPASHSQAMSCGSGGNCHAGAHNVQMPAPSACVSCHYAAAGTSNCN